MAALNVVFNRDNTITVRVGRQVESIGLEGKTKAQIFDAVKWAAISKGAVVSDVQITEMLWSPSQK
jgi:hypothetical protein